MAENLLHDHADSLRGGVLIVPGRTGAFEVTLDDRLVYSKLQRDDFPEPNHVETAIGALLEGQHGDG